LINSRERLRRERERGIDTHTLCRAAIIRLREQMEIYSYQFKLGETCFNKDQMCLSGKVGGMKDDVAICLQLVVYWSGLEVVPQ